jgi:hypothetical protein
MRNAWLALIPAAIIAAAPLRAADPMTVARLYDSQLKSIEAEVVSLAEAMPESKYAFKPSGGEFANVRTFADQVKHIATVNYMVAAAALAEKPPRDLGKNEGGPEDVRSKTDIVLYLKDSFAYAHKATAALTDANQLDLVATPWGNQKAARAAMANLAIYHSMDHYGQMAIYARLNGLVPPASR